MTYQPFNILPMFVSPLITASVPNCEALNRNLREYFTSLRAQGETHRNPNKTPTNQVRIFESSFDLFSDSNHAVQTLKQICLEATMMQVAEFNGYNPSEIENLRIHHDSWFHLTEYGGYIAAHNHPNASWSGTYCVYPGKFNPDYPEGGMLRFTESRHGARMHYDRGNANLKSPYRTGARAFAPKAGSLFLFPSYLVHEVSPYFGDDERITVAFNCWFS